MGYTKEVVKGVSWMGFLSFSTKLIGFLKTIILARILVPEQFGAYGIALLSLGLLETLTQTGVNTVLIQEDNIEKKFINSAWVVSIFRGILITAILLIFAPIVSSFFNSPQSLSLLLLISIVPFLRGFINPSEVRFQKDLMFAKNFWFQAIILSVDTITSIAVTYITKNPMGIVIGLMTGVVFELFLSFAVIAPRPNLNFEIEYIKRIFHRGKWITATAIFDYLFFNSDNIVVGRLLGAGSLGVYQLAYSIAVTPLTQIGTVFNFVTFPIFAKMPNDISRLKRAFLKTFLAVFFLSIPIVFILFFLPQIFIFILGEKWSKVVSILPILSLLGLIKALSGPAYSFLLSLKKQHYLTAITFVNIAGLLITIVPFVLNFGIFGAGSSAFFGAAISVPLFIYYIHKVINEKISV